MKAHWVSCITEIVGSIRGSRCHIETDTPQATEHRGMLDPCLRRIAQILRRQARQLSCEPTGAVRLNVHGAAVILTIRHRVRVLAVIRAHQMTGIYDLGHLELSDSVQKVQEAAGISAPAVRMAQHR